MKTKFNPWPLGIIVFFLLLVAGLAILVVIATTHRDHLVSENYYEQELKFQGRIDGRNRAQQCGATIRLDAAAGKLLVTVPAALVAEKISGTIEFYRPSAPELDHNVTFAPRADGTQALDVSRLAAGNWQVRVQWNAAGQDYLLEQKIVI